jgi:hypothetical protein
MHAGSPGLKKILATLLALCLSIATAAAQEPRLVLDARVSWKGKQAGFGGFSGLAVSDSGTRILAISDRGHWARADLLREEGRLTGVRTTGFGPLLAIKGTPLDGEDVDAEGLAIDAQGRAWISFEAFHRIRIYDPIDGPAKSVLGHRRFKKLQNNSALEALAMDASGTLYAIPERSGKWERPFPVFRYRNGKWDKKLKIRRDGKFLVVGADFGPDGNFYVLERDFKWLGGFGIRIRRFTLDKNGFGDEITLLEVPTGSLDNMEGISVWRDSAGLIRVTLIADDNFSALLETAIAEYILTRD